MTKVDYARTHFTIENWKKKRLNVLHLCYNISITNVVDPWTSNKFMKTRLLCVHTKHFFFRIRLGLRWINILYNKTKIDKMSFERWDSMLMVVDVILTLNFFPQFLSLCCYSYEALLLLPHFFFGFFFQPSLGCCFDSRLWNEECVWNCVSLVFHFILQRGGAY